MFSFAVTSRGKQASDFARFPPTSFVSLVSQSFPRFRENLGIPGTSPEFRGGAPGAWSLRSINERNTSRTHRVHPDPTCRRHPLPTTRYHPEAHRRSTIATPSDRKIRTEQDERAQLHLRLERTLAPTRPPRSCTVLRCTSKTLRWRRSTSGARRRRRSRSSAPGSSGAHARRSRLQSCAKRSSSGGGCDLKHCGKGTR